MPTLLQDPMDEEMLTLKDIQTYFGVSRETARKITRRPGFPLFCHDRLRRIPKSAFLRWVAVQTGQTPDDAC